MAKAIKFTNALDKILYDAKSNLEKVINQENWSEANTKQGYYNGVFDYSDFKDETAESLERRKAFAEWNLEGTIKNAQYGKAAYWRSYLSGWATAETSHRLDVLTGKL